VLDVEVMAQAFAQGGKHVPAGVLREQVVIWRCQLRTVQGGAPNLSCDPRTVRITRALLVAGALVMLVAGCSGSAVDSSCDVTGISSEVEHMVGESGLELSSLDALSCSGAWALSRATVTGPGQSEQVSTFLFKKTESGWFLKDPAIACGGDPGMDTVAEALREDACRGT
jgi:hypothetical protein